MSRSRYNVSDSGQESLTYSSDSDVTPERSGTSKMNRRALFFCELCEIECCSIEALQKHFAGTKHQKKLGLNGLSSNLRDEYEIEYQDQLSGKVVECTLCEVVFHGLERAFHFKSEKHRALCNFATESELEDDSKWLKVVADAPATGSLEEEIMSMDTPERVSDGYFCKLCAATLTTKTLFQAHIEGKRHQKKARWHYLCLEGDNTEVNQYWCRICNMFCTDRDALTAHYRGRNHIKTLQKKNIIEIEKPPEEETPAPEAKKPTSSRNGKVKVKQEPLDIRLDVKRDRPPDVSYRSSERSRHHNSWPDSPILSEGSLSPPPPPRSSHREKRTSHSSRSGDRRASHRSSIEEFASRSPPLGDLRYTSLGHTHTPAFYHHDNRRSRSRSRSRERHWPPIEDNLNSKPSRSSRSRHDSSSSHRRSRIHSSEVVSTTDHRSSTSLTRTREQIRRESYMGLYSDSYTASEVTSFLQSRKDDLNRQDDRNDFGRKLGDRSDFGRKLGDRSDFGRKRDDRNDFDDQYDFSRQVNDQNDFSRRRNDRNDDFIRQDNFGRKHDDRNGEFDRKQVVRKDRKHDDISRKQVDRKDEFTRKHDDVSRRQVDRKDEFIRKNNDVSRKHESRRQHDSNRNKHDSQHRSFNRSRSRERRTPHSHWNWKHGSQERIDSRGGRRSIYDKGSRGRMEQRRKFVQKDELDLYFDGFSNDESSEDEDGPPNSSLCVSFILNALRKSIKKKL